MTKIWLKTEWKRAAVMLPVILKRAVALLLVFGMAVGAAAFCAFVISKQPDASQIRIGYTAADNALTDMVVNYVQEMESVKALCSIERVSEEDGLRLLQEGVLSAYVALPDDIVEGILSGENAPATVYMTDDGVVKSLLFRELADAAVGMLQTAQAEIYAVSYVLDEEAYADHAFVQKLYDDINRFNLGMAAGREDLFKPKNVSVTENDTYVIYYGSAALAIYLLLVGAFFGDFFCHSDTWRCMLERRLHTSRAWQVICGFLAGILPMLVVTALPFVTLVLPFVREQVSVGLSWEVFLLIGMNAVLNVLYFMLLYQILGEKRSALLPIGILAVVQAYLSGCIVPSVLLPDLAYAIGKYLPAAFLKKAFTVVLSGEMHKASSAIVGLLVWSIVLFVANVVWVYVGVMRDDGIVKEAVLKEKTSVSVPSVVWVILKRMILKKSILFSLAFMAGISVFIVRLEEKSDTTFCVAVFDESGEYEELLLAHDNLVRFQICSSADEVEEFVLRDVAECGYVLSGSLTEDVIAGRANRTVTVYEDADSVSVPLVNEIVFQAVFRHASLEWYQDYMSAFCRDLALTKEAFANQIALGNTFGITFVTVESNGAVNQDAEELRTYSAIPVVVIAVFICGILGVLAVVEDCRKGRFYKRDRGKLAVLTIVLPMFIAAVFGGGLVLLLDVL